MTYDMTAVFHGAGKRHGYDLLVEVFNPRKGIVAQYVNGRDSGEGRVYFNVERDNGAVVVYSIPAGPGRHIPFPCGVVRGATSPDLRKNRTFMHFWDAINEGRAEAGLPEALFANVRDAWNAAMIPTQVEKDLALREEQNREFFNVDENGYEDKF